MQTTKIFVLDTFCFYLIQNNSPLLRSRVKTGWLQKREGSRKMLLDVRKLLDLHHKLQLEKDALHIESETGHIYIL